ncbi:hypothetical protein EniLVp02_0109 [Vibrio phage EniLVp02]
MKHVNDLLERIDRRRDELLSRIPSTESSVSINELDQMEEQIRIIAAVMGDDKQLSKLKERISSIGRDDNEVDLNMLICPLY